MFKNLKIKFKFRERIINKVKEIRQRGPILRASRLKSIIHKIRSRNR